MIHVRQRADNWRNLGAPKSAAGKRDIPLTPLVLNTLRTWRATCPPGELGLVFPNGAGKIESHANLRNRFFIPLQIAAGVVTRPARPNTASTPCATPLRACLSPTSGGHPTRPGGHGTCLDHHDLRPVRTSLRTPRAMREAMKKLEAAVLSA